MEPKTKLLRLLTLLSAALFLILAALVNAGTTRAQNGAPVTKISVNGRSAWVTLVDSETGTTGILYASEDQIAHTKALEFGIATPDPADPDLVVVLQGAGQIPSTAFTIDSKSAHLALTTPDSYFVNRCVVSLVTGEYTCAPGDPVTFDLTWVRNGIDSFREKTKSIVTFGPITTKSDGEFTRVVAIVSGTAGGITSANLSGILEDTGGKEFIREITVAANP